MHYIFRDIDDVSMLLNEGALGIGRDMGHSFSTTDTVLEAHGDEFHPVKGLIKGNIVSLKTFAENEFVKVQNIFSKYKSSLSLADCSVIYCAIATNGILVTSEKILLNASAVFKIKTCTTALYFQEVKLYKTG